MTGSVAGIIPNPFGGVYHSSKAALHMYVDCLRLELEPFGVRVITGVTGGVQSNIAQNGATRFKIDPESLYRPVRDALEARFNTSQRKGTTTRDEYAREIVGEILSGRPRDRIWKGAFSFQIWILNSFFPYWITEYIMARRFGMIRLKELLSRS